MERPVGYLNLAGLAAIEVELFQGVSRSCNRWRADEVINAVYKTTTNLVDIVSPIHEFGRI